MSRRGHWARNRASAESVTRRLGGPTRVRGVTIPCVRYADTRRFYGDRLGLQLVGQARGHAVFEGGVGRVVLIDAGQVPGFSRREGQGLYLELEVTELGRVRAALEADGVRVFEPRQGSGGRLLTVQDPEGNLVNLIQADEQRR